MLPTIFKGREGRAGIRFQVIRVFTEAWPGSTEPGEGSLPGRSSSAGHAAASVAARQPARRRKRRRKPAALRRRLRRRAGAYRLGPAATVSGLLPAF